MDLSNAVFFAIAAAALWFGPRLIIDSVGRAGDNLSVLFVPPDWKLGWPHGVQEGDADWGWRAPAVTTDGAGPGAALTEDSASPELIDLIDGTPPVGGGGLLVEPRLVHRT
jgi:hypothetical protein